MHKVNIALVGAGAFGIKHLDGLKNVENAIVTALVGTNFDKTQLVADQYGIPHVYTSLEEALEKDVFDAAILCTPTQIHASQGIACLKAGKHVQVEIPICDKIEEGRELVKTQKETGLIAMGGHTRRFNPSHQFIHNQVEKGELTVYQMDVQTYFFRRTNTNALGQPRSWTDSLLWHHAAHTIDLFAYQTQSPIVQAHALEGRYHEELKIPMDMSIQLKAQNGAICTLSLSFNNNGPFGSHFRYICDHNTYVANYDDLFDGYDNQVDLSKVAVSNNGIELQDREFINAILENREPNGSVKQVFPCYEVIANLEQQLKKAEGAKTKGANS